MRRVVMPLGALLIGLAVTQEVGAQDRSIFSLLDPAGRSVGPDGGAPVDGALTSDDVLSAGGRRVQVWSLAAQPGDELQIDLRSADFDAYLYAVGPGLGDGLRDDDGGEGLNARLCLLVDQAGDYRVVASSLGGETGAFTLRVSEQPGATNGSCPIVANSAEYTDPAALPTDGRNLTVGDDASGFLGPEDPVLFGSPAQAWTVEGVAGEPFAVDLRSDAFDAYLMMHGPGLDPFLEDDDGAGRCDSRIVTTFPQTGTYRVVASSISSQVSGAYTLSARTLPEATSTDGCMASLYDETGGFSTNTEVTEAGSLRIGVRADGQMTGSEGLFQGRYVQSWTLEAAAGDRLSIELRSADFDSYLYFSGPGFPEPLFDDDGAGAGTLPSRICVDVPETGTYSVLAGQLSGVDAGARFTLQAAREGEGSLCDSYTQSPEVLAATLSDLPTDGRSLGVGDEVTGRLDVDALRHPESGYQIQPWRLPMSADQVVFVDVESTEFDPLLYAVGGGIPGSLFVDDAGDGCNTRVQIGPGVEGDVTLLVGAYYDGASGSFTLRASANPPTLAGGGCVTASGGTGLGATQASADVSLLQTVSSGATRPLEVGTEVTGNMDGGETLSSGLPAQAWSIDLAAGETYAIELISDVFDPVLYLDGPGLAGALTDDDSLGNADSRIVYEAGASGTMRITASAYTPDAGGSYRLRVFRIVR
jgi:hypothetical protein